MSIIAMALMELSPNAEWTTNGETVDDIIWHDEVIEKPNDEVINAKIEELTNGEPLRKLRVVRNTMLSQTDWWASSDLTMTSEQTTYRQALRDITNSYQSLDDVVWPTKP
jgi:hypothetical protein